MNQRGFAMGFFDFLKRPEKKSMDSSSAISYPSGYLYSGSMTSSGQEVNEWTALRQSTVLQCVTVLANGVSQIPFRLMKGKQKPASENQLYWLFKEKPNRWQSSFEFWQMVMLHLALQGEIVVWKVTSRGVIQELIPFAQGNFSITQEYRGGWAVNTYHLVKEDESTVEVSEDEIWHLRWREYDLRVALPQIKIAADVVGVALAGDEFSAKSLKNGAALNGILTAKQPISAEQQNLIQEGWEKSYGGAGNAHKTVVLGADLDYKPMGQTNTDAQFIEQRKLQIEEICRCWNVNPLLVFYFDNTASYGNSEQMLIQHVVHTMSPWYRMIEESAYVNLLTEDERRRKGLYFAFNDNALLRADFSARGEFYHKLFNIGAITPNEIREKEDMPPMEGGDKLYVQGAIVPLEDAGKWEKDGGASSNSGSSSVPNEEKESEDNTNG